MSGGPTSGGPMSGGPTSGGPTSGGPLMILVAGPDRSGTDGDAARTQATSIDEVPAA